LRRVEMGHAGSYNFVGEWGDEDGAALEVG
jgi:hypothetical protein